MTDDTFDPAANARAAAGTNKTTQRRTRDGPPPVSRGTQGRRKR